MALTLTRDVDRSERISRNLTCITGSLAFDSSYPTGGESSTGVTGYFATCLQLLLEPSGGYLFAWDKTNNKVLAYLPSGTPAIASESAHTHAVALDTGASAAGASHNHAFTGTAQPPLLVYEEVMTVTTNVGTSAFTPFYVVAIDVTAGGVTGAFNVIPTGETPLTKQCAVTLTNGTFTFLAADAVTSARITYIPLQTHGPFVSANRVIDESVTAAAAKTALASRAGAVQYVWDDTDGVIDGLEPVGEAPSATHKAVIDITNGASATDIDSHADDEANTLKVTYIKYSALPPIMWREDTDLTMSTGDYNWTNNGYRCLAVPGLGTQVVGEETAAGNEVATWAGKSITAANTVAVWDPILNNVDTANTNAFVTLAMPWFYLDEAQLQPNTPAGTNAAEATHTHASGTLADAASGAGSSHTHTATGEAADEVGNGTDLSALTAVKFIAIGLK